MYLVKDRARISRKSRGAHELLPQRRRIYVDLGTADAQLPSASNANPLKVCSAGPK